MDDLLAARSQMAFSLAFHIIFACIGMVMPWFMAVSHWKWLKTGDTTYRDLTKAWSRGVAIFFVVGAVSGTMLSFELGLLWPQFMEHAGPIFGMPFSLEGTAFFVEAIALGLFLYGWKRLPKWIHWGTGLVVGIMGVASGILVVAANAWMNAPSGFDVVNGEYVNIDPIAAMFNEAWFSQALHMIIAAFVATGFAVAGLHALLLRRGKRPEFHLRAVKIALAFAAVAAFLQPISGDISAKDVAERQPAKLAAMEAHFKTEAPADLIIGGIPNMETGEVDFAIRIPGFLSFLAHGNFDAEVIGLDQIPEDERPPVPIVHYSFQVMVGIGFLLLGIGIWYMIGLIRKKQPLNNRFYLRLLALVAPLGFVAVEAGWMVTEIGRQPWIIQGVMKTSEALTPMPGIVYSFFLFVGIYVLLAVVVTLLMIRQIRALHRKPPAVEQEEPKPAFV